MRDAGERPGVPPTPSWTVGPRPAAPPPRGSPRQPRLLPGGSRCQSPGPAAAAAATLTRKRTWKRNVPEGGEQGPGLSAEAVAGGSAVSTLAEAKESRAGPWLAWVGRRVSGPPRDSPSFSPGGPCHSVVVSAFEGQGRAQCLRDVSLHPESGERLRRCTEHACPASVAPGTGGPVST